MLITYCLQIIFSTLPFSMLVRYRSGSEITLVFNCPMPWKLTNVVSWGFPPSEKQLNIFITSSFFWIFLLLYSSTFTESFTYYNFFQLRPSKHFFYLCITILVLGLCGGVPYTLEFRFCEGRCPCLTCLFLTPSAQQKVLQAVCSEKLVSNTWNPKTWIS